MNLPYVQEQVDNYAYRWDMLGNKKSKTPFSFDVNPVDASGTVLRHSKCLMARD